MAAENGNFDLSLNAVILHATKSLRAKLKDRNVLSESDLQGCLTDVKSLSQLLTVLEQFNSSAETTESQEELLLCTVRDICFPLLYSLHILPESEKANSEKGRALTSLVNLILACCYKMRDQSLPRVIIQLVIPLCTITKISHDVLLSLKDGGYHNTKVEPLNQYLSLELLAAVLTDEILFQRFLSNISQLGLSREDLLVHLFNITVCCIEEKSAFSRAFTVVAKLLDFIPIGLREKCEDQVWTCYIQPEKMSCGVQAGRQNLWKSLYVFFCLKNYFFPLEVAAKDKLAAKLSSDSFWSIVQEGLVSSEPLHRKLAVYLIKRLVDTCEKNGCKVNVTESSVTETPIFWWSPEAKKQLSAVWEDFILMIEVLEEKQVGLAKISKVLY